jgi:hypothetical protein
MLKLGKLNHIWKSKNLVAAQIPDSRDNIDPKFENIVDNKDPQYKPSIKPEGFYAIISLRNTTW